MFADFLCGMTETEKITSGGGPEGHDARAVPENHCRRGRWPASETEPDRTWRPESRIFSADRATVGEARRWLRLVLDGHPRLDDAVLLLSEVFTNAVVHTRSGRVEVTVLPDEDGTVTIQVADQGSETFPFACGCVRDTLAESGRGIDLIRSQAQRWGFTEEPTGGLLWFELASNEDGATPSPTVEIA
ncbi:hypothetical protein GCM10010106_04720 [Thermopolyspora flexuosa]|nr:hypothetical protein GCM10010106_04720 [Thermopolyspora flexuosa]